MILFSGWNWFLAVFGNTTIEFMKNEGTGNNKNEAKLRFDSISDNLYRIFGTHKFFRVFSPSFRNVPFTGLEWSFRFKDDGYDCDGIQIGLDDFDIEHLAAPSMNEYGTNVDSDDEVEMITISGLSEDGNSGDTEESHSLASSHV